MSRVKDSCLVAKLGLVLFEPHFVNTKELGSTKRQVVVCGWVDGSMVLLGGVEEVTSGRVVHGMCELLVCVCASGVVGGHVAVRLE